MNNIVIKVIALIIVCFVSISSILSQNVYTVTKTTDPDPFVYRYHFDDSICAPELIGTLQWAIRKANDTQGDCIINFNIPGTGPYIILIDHYIPQINNSVIIDGTTQAGYSLNNPIIIIDGQELIGDGLIVSGADSVVIRGLHIRNLTNRGIAIYYSNHSKIIDNIVNMKNYQHLGTGRVTVAHSNNVDIYGNIMGDETIGGGLFNSAGIYLWDVNYCNIGGAGFRQPNTIRQCVWGATIGDSYQIKISRNLIYDNILGLWLLENANNNKQAPEILNFFNNILSGTSLPGDSIEIFGSTGFQSANEYLTTVYTDALGNWSTAITNFNWSYFIATATDVTNNTSEFSNAFQNVITCIADAGVDVALCYGESAQLNASAGVSYLWASTPNDNSLSGQENLQNPVVTPSTTTTYTLIVSDALGCTASDDVVVTVYPLPIADAGSDTIIFVGDSVQIGTTSINVYTYAWSPAVGLSDSTVAEPWAKPLQNTTYYLTVIDDNMCVAYDSVLISVLPTINHCYLADTVDVTDTCQMQTIFTDNEKKWLAFVATDSVISIRITDTRQLPIASITEIAIFNGNCENLELIKKINILYDFSYILILDSLNINEIYFLKIFNEIELPDSFYICLTKHTDLANGGWDILDCPPENCNIIRNPGFDITHLHLTATPFYSEQVCGWHHAWGQVFVMDAQFQNTPPVTQPHYIKLQAKVVSTPLQFNGSTAIYQDVNIISGKQYQLQYLYKVYDNETVQEFFVVLTNQNPIDPHPLTQFGNVDILAPTGLTILYKTNFHTSGLWITETVPFTANNNYNYIYLYPRAPDITPISCPSVIGIDNFYIYTEDLLFDITANIDICNGDNINIELSNIQGESPYSFIWNTGQTSQNINVSPTNTTTYTVTVTDANGCTASDNVVVTVNPLPNVNVDTDKYICEGESVQIGPTFCFAHYDYLWSHGSNLCKPTVSPTITTTYTLTITYNVTQCSITYDVVVNVYPRPTAYTGPDKEICIGESTQLGILPPPYSLGSFSWIPSTDLSCTDCQSPVATPSVTTTYTLTVNIMGCTASDNVVVTVFPLPQPTITVSGKPCINSPNLQFHSLPYTNYHWNFGDGSTPSSLQNPSHTYSMPGTYQVTLTVTDANGCTACTSHVIQIASVCCAFDYTYSNMYPTGEITDDEIWQYNNWFNKTIIIKAPYTLTIAQGVTIEFGPFGKIIVEQGDYNNGIPAAELIMQTGSKLTSLYNTFNQCPVMWQGVEVWGNASLKHITSHISYQGKITIEKDASIEHAHNAVLLGRRNICFTNVCPPPPPLFSKFCIKTPYLTSYSGGIINADGGIFNNNAISVHFAAYNYDNASIIKSCSFYGGGLLDPGYNNTPGYSTYVYENSNNPNSPLYGNFSTSPNPLFANANPSGRSDKGIYMWGIRFAPGLPISPPIYPPVPAYPYILNRFTDMEKGMESYSSRYNATLSKFDNLTFGIRIFNTNSPVQGHTIFNNEFFQITSNYLQIEGSRFDKISRNTLGEINNSIGQGAKVGILLNNTSSFDISDNDFNHLQIGIRCFNSGAGGGNIRAKERIYNIDNTGNFFNRCYYNIQTTGNNSRLNIKCNTAYNQYPTEYSGNNWLNFSIFGSPQSILAHQGQASLTDSRKPAGNKFTPAPPQPDRRQITNYSSIPYHYEAHSPTGAILERIPVVSANITLNTSNAQYEDGISCKACIFPFCNYQDKIMENNNLIDQLLIEYISVRSNLDRGQTIALLNAINKNIPTPAGTLKNMLLAASPISDEVLTAFILRQNPIPPGIFKDVVIPNSPVSDTVRVFLEQKLLTLPTGIAQQIENAQGHQNAYRTLTLIQREIEQLETERQMAFNALIIEKTDSGDFAMAMALLEQENTVNAKQTIIGTYISENELTEALIALNNFTPSTPAENDWKALMNLLIDLGVNDKTVFEISPQQELFIRDLAYAPDVSLATVNAQAILRLLYGEEFTLNFSQTSTFKMVNDSTSVHQQTSGYHWQLFPNPANNFIEILYQLPEDCIGNIEVFSILGRKTNEILLQSNKNKEILITDKYAAGIYYFKLSVNNKYIETKKIILIK